MPSPPTSSCCHPRPRPSIAHHPLSRPHPRPKKERCKAVIQKSIKLSLSPHLLLGLDHELAGAQQIEDLLLAFDDLVLDGSGADLDPVHEEAAGVELVEAADGFAFGWGLKDEGAEVLLIGHGSLGLLHRTEGDVARFIVDKFLCCFRVELLIYHPVLQDGKVVPLTLLGYHNFALLLHSELQIFMGQIPVLNLDDIFLVLVDAGKELPFDFDIVVLDLVFVKEVGLLLEDDF